MDLTIAANDAIYFQLLLTFFRAEYHSSAPFFIPLNELSTLLRVMIP